MTVDDLNITLASGAANAAAANGAGLTVDGASATLTYASTGDKWVFNKAPYYNTDRLLTTADEGTGNGLDADTVDGLEASQFLRSDQSDTMSGNLTMGTNYIYGDITSAWLRVGSQAEFRTVRSITIIADDDDSSTTEALTLGAGQNELKVTSNGATTDNDKLTYNGNIVWHAGNDGSTSGLDADTLDGIEASSFLRSDADDTTTGQIQITRANNTATGGGQIYLNGATGNRIDFNTNGVAAPAFTTRSAGTKLVLYPNISGSRVDYALGIESSTLWYSVDQSSAQHRWYAGTTQLADLKGTGELVIGSTSLTGTASQKLQVTGGAYISGDVGIGTTNPQYKLHVVGSFGATTKSFIIDHPTKEGKKLQYGSLEGPENGVYVRGRLKDNNTIELPDHWTGLVDEETITVNLTPIGRKAPLHSVVDIVDNTVVVESANDVVDCFYTVFGERKDVEKLEVEF
jgi:hypothetical protein